MFWRTVHPPALTHTSAQMYRSTLWGSRAWLACRSPRLPPSKKKKIKPRRPQLDNCRALFLSMHHHTYPTRNIPKPTPLHLDRYVRRRKEAKQVNRQEGRSEMHSPLPFWHRRREREPLHSTTTSRVGIRFLYFAGLVLYSAFLPVSFIGITKTKKKIGEIQRYIYMYMYRWIYRYRRISKIWVQRGSAVKPPLNKRRKKWPEQQ